jgi:hypothetical protein
MKLFALEFAVKPQTSTGCGWLARADLLTRIGWFPKRGVDLLTDPIPAPSPYKGEGLRTMKPFALEFAKAANSKVWSFSET